MAGDGIVDGFWGTLAGWLGRDGLGMGFGGEWWRCSEWVWGHFLPFDQDFGSIRVWWDGSRRGIDWGMDITAAMDQQGVEFGVVALQRG